MGHRLELAERINKLLVYRNKQREREILELQRLLETNRVEVTPTTGKTNIATTTEPEARDGTETKDENAEERLEGNEQLLLSQIEQQEQVIRSLQDRLTIQSQQRPSVDEHLEYLHKRIVELAADSNRHFEKWRSARGHQARLVASRGLETSAGSKRLASELKTLEREEQETARMYEKRLLEVTSVLHWDL